MDDNSSSSTDSWRPDPKLGLVDEDLMASSSSTSSSSLQPSKKTDNWPNLSASVKDEAYQLVKPKEPTSKGEEVILSFGSSEFEVDFDGDGLAAAAGGVRKRTRSLQTAQEHVLAERRRRQKLAQMFLDLASLIPGLSKIDKVSIVEEAAKYIKQLEEQAKLLEQQMEEETADDVELDGSSSCSDEDTNNKISSENSDNPALEIKATVSGKEVLLRMFFKKDYEMVPKIFTQLSKLQLRALKSNIMSFGEYALHITIIAQVEGEFCMTMENLVEKLRESLE